MVSVLFTVSTGMPRTYLFAVYSPVAVLPEYEAIDFVTFHAVLYTVYDGVAPVQLEVVPV